MGAELDAHAMSALGHSRSGLGTQAGILVIADSFTNSRISRGRSARTLAIRLSHIGQSDNPP